MNTALYRKRRLRCNAHILTVDQIRDLGKLVGLASLRQAMDHFTSPSTLFRWNKLKLVKIHRYLLDHGITREKLPSRHKRQGDHACLLLHIIYPGYPVAKAKDQAYRTERECRQSSQKTEFAYDLLPASDVFERLDELTQLAVYWQNQETYTVSVALKKLEPYTRKRCTLPPDEAAHFRLHLYLWKSSQLCPPPRCISLEINGKETWTKEDDSSLQRGHRHIDITEKVDWQSDLANSVTFTFIFDDDKSAHANFMSICTVWQKSPQELASQLYMQSTASYVSQAIDVSKDAKQTQRDSLGMLQRCPFKDRNDMEKTESIFVACATAFPNALCDDQNLDESNKDDVVLGDERVSTADPIMLGRIKHPARGVFCRHTACFDALYFFKCHYHQQQWQCPVCFVHIKSIQELYMDFPMLEALRVYPDESHFVVRQGSYLPASSVYGASRRLPLAPIELQPCQSIDAPTACDVVELV